MKPQQRKKENELMRRNVTSSVVNAIVLPHQYEVEYPIGKALRFSLCFQAYLST